MTTDKKPRRKTAYHHGDLREALLKAAEAELADKGFEGFSLRAAAKRAGVSHAPAHHFGDTGDLLTALATIAAERLTRSMLDRHARADNTPRAQFIASGVGYIEFALANPALFKLMFGSERPKSDDAKLMHHSGEAFNVLVGDVGAIVGYDPLASDQGRLSIAAAWSLVHGVANLLIANRLSFVLPMLDRDVEGTLTRLIERVAPR